MKKKFNIQGMTCSACQSHVYNAVCKLNGVSNINVNLVSNTMECETNNITDSEIIGAIKSAGYGATPYEELTYKKKSDTKLIKLIISIVFWLLLMYIAMGSMIGLPLPSFIAMDTSPLGYALAQIVILIPIVVLNFHYFTSGYKRLFKLTPNMDSLVAVGATAAIGYGIYGIVMIIIGLTTGQPELVEKYHMDLYFEGAGTILTLVSVGKYIESYSKTKTSNSIKMLMDLTGKTAIIVDGDNETEVEINKVKVGDIIKVAAGMSVPVDGKIIKGEGNFDESSISGESLPNFHQVGDVIKSGTINTDGLIYMEATTTSGDSSIAKIVALVEEAGNSKAPIAKLADKVSAVFVPVVFGLAILAFIIWMIVYKDFGFAISIGISVLVISCPCALGLATPIAIMISTGVAAKNHILVKNAAVLQELSSVKTIIMDKTGTITSGNLEVVETNLSDDNLKVLFALEKDSIHPLAVAINNYCTNKNLEELTAIKVKTIPGKGIEGTINKVKYYAGNEKYLNDLGITDLKNIDTNNHSVIYLTNKEEVLGYVLIADTIKESSITAIKKFKELGLKTVMLTGDNEANALYIKEQVAIDDLVANVVPEEKASVVKSYQAKGEKVLMIGDGINDAIALEQADIGMAIGAGSDIAIESADIILARNSLLDAVDAYRLSKKTLSNIKLSLFWAFFYNALAIPVAMGVFYLPFGLKLNPMIASIAMCISSVSVVLNALRLFTFKKVEENQKMVETKIIVEGMMCEHCVAHVKEAIEKLPGVKTATPNLETKEVLIESKKELNLDQVKAAVSKAGYQVK